MSETTQNPQAETPSTETSEKKTELKNLVENLQRNMPKFPTSLKLIREFGEGDNKEQRPLPVAPLDYGRGDKKTYKLKYLGYKISSDEDLNVALRFLGTDVVKRIIQYNLNSILQGATEAAVGDVLPNGEWSEETFVKSATSLTTAGESSSDLREEATELNANLMSAMNDFRLKKITQEQFLTITNEAGPRYEQIMAILESRKRGPRGDKEEQKAA